MDGGTAIVSKNIIQRNKRGMYREVQVEISFIEDLIFYVKDPNFTPKFQKLITKVDNVLEHKIKTHKSVMFLYINNEPV